ELKTPFSSPASPDSLWTTFLLSSLTTILCLKTMKVSGRVQRCGPLCGSMEYLLGSGFNCSVCLQRLSRDTLPRECSDPLYTASAECGSQICISQGSAQD